MHTNDIAMPVTHWNDILRYTDDFLYINTVIFCKSLSLTIPTQDEHGVVARAEA